MSRIAGAGAIIAISDQTLFLATVLLSALVLLAAILTARGVEIFWRLALVRLRPLRRQLLWRNLATAVSLALLAGLALWLLWPRLAGLSGFLSPGPLVPRRVDSILFGICIAVLLVPWILLLLRRRRTEGDDTRLRWLALALVFLFCAKLALPYADRWLGSASNIEVGFLKLTLETSASTRTADATFGFQGDLSLDRSAALEGTATALEHIMDIVEPAGFYRTPGERPHPEWTAVARIRDQRWQDAVAGGLDLGQAPLLLRDALFSAYLGTSTPDEFSHAIRELEKIVRNPPWKPVAKVPKADDPANIEFGGWATSLAASEEFFANITHPLLCLHRYAQSIRDFRLLLLDTHEMVRAFLALSSRDLRQAYVTGRNDGPARFAMPQDLPYVLAGMVRVARGGLENFHGAVGGLDAICPSTDRWLAPVAEPWPPMEARILREVAAVREAIGAGDSGATPAAVSPFDYVLIGLTTSLLDPQRLYQRDRQQVEFERLVGLLNTPYLALSAARLFDSIGAFESAISVLARWHEDMQDDGLLPPVPDNPAIGPAWHALRRAVHVWLRVRVVLEMDALIGDRRDFLSNPGYAALMHSSYREMRDLGTRWLDSSARDACGDGREMAEGQHPTLLYRQVEQSFRFFLINHRERYFRTIRQPLPTDDPAIEEARQYAALEDGCFPKVPGFSTQAKGWIGTYALTYANLLWRRGSEAQRSFGKEAGAPDVTEARTQFYRAVKLLEQQVAASTTEQTGTPLEGRLLGGASAWQVYLEEARRGQVALDSLLGQ